MQKAAILALLGAIAAAPLQCTRDPDPKRAVYEDPAEALYALAEQFRAEGNEPARKTTLRRLADRYPSSRFARMAREELGLPLDGEPAADRAP